MIRQLLKFLCSFCIAIFISNSTFSTTFNLSNQALNEIAEQVYIYAYPLVLMQVTKNVMTNVEKPTNGALGRAPINQFMNMSAFPEPGFKDVIRPNVDTLYSIAWLDLSKEPLVFSVPDTQKRYFLMPMPAPYTSGKHGCDNIFKNIC